MLNKVLVFESDPAFADELRSEFERLGARTTVVDDGNVGLQQAASDKPDLILLAIELPRVNGFSVCNKLKKDPLLKDVPLIIMSNESSDETFDQHKKLRTRAEDYIHKPVSFGELLERVRKFVDVQGPTSEATQAEGGILIDDEIEVGSADYLLEDDGPDSPAELPSGIDELDETRASVDEDVDAFAESAFGRLTSDGGPRTLLEPRPLHNGASSESASAIRQPLGAASAASRTSRPPPVGLDFLEHERIKGELAVSRDRVDAAERELDDAVREVSKLRLEVGDSTRMSREIDELRAKLSAAAKGGGNSSRDFLDLREALNRKDKEILAFREQLSKKDRESVEAQDRALALERSRADVEDRLLSVERELSELRERDEATVIERDLARKSSDDYRGRLEKLKTEGEARERQVAELRAKQVDERMATEARLAAIRAEADQVLANERAEHARALDQAEQRRGADLESARRERDAAFVEAQKLADRQRQQGLAEQLGQLRQEHEATVAALRRAQTQDVERMRAEALSREDAALAGLRSEHSDALKALGEERDARITTIEARASRDLSEALDRIAHVEAERSDARRELLTLTEERRVFVEQAEERLAELEQQLGESEAAKRELQVRLESGADRIAMLEGEVETSRAELAEVRERLGLEVATAGRRRDKAEADRQSLERAKDALAVALSQIEETESAENGAR